MEMKKSGIDMLHGPIWNKIPLFALPVAATAILGQLFNASDLAVVGNFAGEARTAAVAAVGANSSVVSLVVNLFTGVALGANVVIAGAIGREDTDAAQRAVDFEVVPGIRLHESPRQYDLENVSAAAVGDSPTNEFPVLLVGDRAVFFPSQREVVGSEIAVADHAFDFVQTRIFAVRE